MAFILTKYQEKQNNEHTDEYSRYLDMKENRKAKRTYVTFQGY